MTDFHTYYRQQFQEDLREFLSVIPDKGKHHYNNSEVTIQYFTLTPNYKYLDKVPRNRQGLFFVSLFWTVLVDQVFYSHFRDNYDTFQRLTVYPKFIGNCTGTGFFTSDCGHHQHPKKILDAINDKEYTGNRFDFDREPYDKDKIATPRQTIDYNKILLNSIDAMRKEIQDYFSTHQTTMDWSTFWEKCKKEFEIKMPAANKT